MVDYQNGEGSGRDTSPSHKHFEATIHLSTGPTVSPSLDLTTSAPIGFIGHVDHSGGSDPLRGYPGSIHKHYRHRIAKGMGSRGTQRDGHTSIRKPTANRSSSTIDARIGHSKSLSKVAIDPAIDIQANEQADSKDRVEG